MTKFKTESMFTKYLIILTLSNLICFSSGGLADGRFKRLMKTDRYVDAKAHATLKMGKHNSKATADFWRQQPKADAWKEKAKLADDKHREFQLKKKRLSEEGYPMPRPLGGSKYVPHPNDRGSLDQ